MIPDPEQLIPAPHAPTGLSSLMRSPGTEAKREVRQHEMDAAGCLPLTLTQLFFFINQVEEVMTGNEKEDQEDFLHLQ